MANEPAQPEKFFLNRFGMTEGSLERVLGNALERKADYADLYFEYRNAEALALEESMVNHTSKSISQGVGVRVCADDRSSTARPSIFRSKSAPACSRKSTRRRGRSIRAFAT